MIVKKQSPKCQKSYQQALFDPIFICEAIIGAVSLNQPQKIKNQGTDIDLITYFFDKFQNECFPFNKTHELSLKAVYNMTQGTQNYKKLILKPKTLQNYLIDEEKQNLRIIKFHFYIGTKLKLSLQNIQTKLNHKFIQKWTCPISLDLMRTPVQIRCGHIFDRRTLQDLMMNGMLKCPLCRHEIQADKNHQFKVCEEMFEHLCQCL